MKSHSSCHFRDGRRVGKAPSVDPVSGNEANTKVRYDGEMARPSNQPQQIEDAEDELATSPDVYFPQIFMPS